MKTLVITLYTKNEISRLKNGKAPVFFKLSSNGTKTTFPAGCYVEQKRWESTSKLSKGRLDQEETESRDYLNGIIKQLNKIEADFLESGKPYTAEMIKNRLLERDVESVAKGKTLADAFISFKEWYMIEVKKGEKKADSHGKYSELEKHLNKFITKKYNQTSFLLANLNDDFQNHFHVYLTEQSTIKAKNTVIKYIHFFRKVIKIAVEKKLIDKYPFTNYAMRKEVEKPTRLSIEEVQTIINHSFTDDSLNKVKDFFFFSCMTGLAYVDLMDLKTEHIIEVGNDKAIVKDRVKTGIQTTIFLQPDALEIIERYAGQNGDNCFPMVSDSEINRKLKTIGEVCKIDQNLHFYMARHTFGCMMVQNGVPLKSQQKAMGHSRLTQTEHYARMFDVQAVSEQKQISGSYTSKAALKVA